MRSALLLALLGCRHAAVPDAIPRATGDIKIDGDWDEQDWAKHALRRQFRGSDGELARPSSEVRFLRGADELFVALYAADETIETRDAFDQSIGPLAVRANAAGAVTPHVEGLRAAVGYDEGTRDNPNDDDEEWVVELAIPLPATTMRAGEHTEVRAARCDVPKDGIERCGSWSGSLTLE